MIGGGTRVFAVLGNPVAHSLSPAIHNAAFRALGLDAVYVALRCAAADVVPLMRGLAAAGGGGNVTAPHKRTAASVVRGPSDQPLETCNTFWAVDGRLVGDETDSIGIRHGWRVLGAPAGPWLLLGTGGSALAAARVAAGLGVEVAVRSRSAERRAAFEREAERLGARTTEPAAGRFVVNCTPLGLASSDPLPIAPHEMPREAVALDLVYAAGGTPWVQALRAAGRLAADGREVLIGQGLAAFERWFPGRQPPDEVMRAAVRAALG